MGRTETTLWMIEDPERWPDDSAVAYALAVTLQ